MLQQLEKEVEWHPTDDKHCKAKQFHFIYCIELEFDVS